MQGSNVIRKAGRAARRMWRGVGGNASVEFVIIFPFFITFFLSVFESGFLMTRHVMLERGLDIAVRDLRLHTGKPTSHDQIRDEVCKNALIIKDCQKVLKVELAPVDTATWKLPVSTADCIDRGDTKSFDNRDDNFQTGLSNQLMFVRACAVVNPFFPGTGLGLQLPKDKTGGYRMVAVSAFVHEPQ